MNTAVGDHYCEGAARLQLGAGFFRPESRPSRDLGVLLLAERAQAAPQAPLAVLDAMAGCGIRALRYGLEVLEGHGAPSTLWANDADPDRLALLQANLAPLQGAPMCTAQTAQQLLAGCLQRRHRFDLLDLDAFGCPSALLPLALEAVRLDGVLYAASTDGRSPTGHDRRGALRQLGAAARAHPASWELALRLQLGVIARSAWALGRGVEPLLSFSEGRTFRTAVRLRRHATADELGWLGLLAHCHGCGDQQVQSLLNLRQWQPCCCQLPPQLQPPLAISGPLWIGPLQHPPTLVRLQTLAQPTCIAPQSLRLLQRLSSDDGAQPRCWPTSAIARQLGGGPPPLQALVEALRQQGHGAQASGVMAGFVRSDAPWAEILQLAARLRGSEGRAAK